jgi:signal recognition particle subunit SRP68
MHIKSIHSEDNQGNGITGTTRSHIISRFHKAARLAQNLTDILKDPEASKTTHQDLLEAEAYRASLSGAEHFEKQSEGRVNTEDPLRWDTCLREYSTARIIYATLFAQGNKDLFREILASAVDPAIRYAAYQARLPRSIPVSTVALRYFPKDNDNLVNQLQQLDPNALSETTTETSTSRYLACLTRTATNQAPLAPQNLGATNIPNTINWRSMNANIVDASVGQALAAVASAEPELSSYLKSNPSALTRDRAGAYDNVLIASQDAADATRRAIEELEKEKVDEGDNRMQDLRVTSLAVNYALVSWRVGRNRVLIGSEDGRLFEEKKAKSSKRARDQHKSEPRGSQLARLRERVVLYDSTIQSIDSIKELRGAMRDESFVREVDGKRAYFQALRCLNIAVSHALLSEHVNALALLARALELAQQCSSSLPSTTSDSSSAPTLDIHKSQADALQTQLQQLVYRHQALVDLHKFHDNASIAAAKHMSTAAPLVQRLSDFPTPGVNVNLKNLVTYPPKLEPIPVKPLFFDVAWNYIDYPTTGKQVVEAQAADVIAEEKPKEEKKKGWFGFGR